MNFNELHQQFEEYVREKFESNTTKFKFYIPQHPSQNLLESPKQKFTTISVSNIYSRNGLFTFFLYRAFIRLNKNRQHYIPYVLNQNMNSVVGYSFKEDTDIDENVLLELIELLKDDLDKLCSEYNFELEGVKYVNLYHHINDFLTNVRRYDAGKIYDLNGELVRDLKDEDVQKLLNF